MQLQELIVIAGYEAQGFAATYDDELVLAVYTLKPLEFAYDLIDAAKATGEGESEEDEQETLTTVSSALTEASMNVYGVGYMIYWEDEPWEQ